MGIPTEAREANEGQRTELPPGPLAIGCEEGGRIQSECSKMGALEQEQTEKTERKIEISLGNPLRALR